MRRALVLALVGVGVLLAIALTAKEDTAATAAKTPLAAVEVQRLDGQGGFALASLEAAPTPALLWFWAPWCEICNAEASSVQQLAARGQGRLTVVAIGGRDTVGPGREFAARRRLGAPMTLLCDEPMTV